MLRIYCDGACSGNPGPGGWAFVIPSRKVEQSGYEEQTTNNRMEITAVYEALKYLYNHLISLGEDIEIITDSQYVVNTMTKGWQKKKNTDLWACIEDYGFYFANIKWTWVKGHSDNKYNQRCDELAVKEYKAKQEQKLRVKESEEKRELEWYGEKVPLHASESIMVGFEPYERYKVGEDHFVLILKCLSLKNVYATEADSKELLTIGRYSECRQALQNYKSLVEDDFQEILFNVTTAARTT